MPKKVTQENVITQDFPISLSFIITQNKGKEKSKAPSVERYLVYEQRKKKHDTSV